MNTMFISDTYGKHEDVLLPRGDMIIHAGNITKNGTESEVLDFLNWFSNLNYKYKVFIAGTQDHFLEQQPERVREMIPPGVTYLEDSSVKIGGLKIWGSPVNPFNHGSAFSRTQEEIGRHWDMIPEDCDMVIAHTPAYGVLDENEEGEHEGSKALFRRLVRIEPTYFICGHQYNAHGYKYMEGIHFINASITNESQTSMSKPVFRWYP